MKQRSRGGDEGREEEGDEGGTADGESMDGGVRGVNGGEDDVTFTCRSQTV